LKKLLIIGYVWPEPKSSAAGSRMLDIIQLFQMDEWQITFTSAAALSVHRVNLQALNVEEKLIELNSSSFDDFVSELQPDVVIFDRFFTEEQFSWRVDKACPHAMKILDTEDLHCLRAVRQRLLKEKQKVFTKEVDRQSVEPILLDMQSLYQEMTNDEECLREIAAIYRCDLSLIISRFEQQLLADHFQIPEQLCFYYPYQSQSYVGLPYSRNPSFLQRQNFLFVGNFRHAPNWDAVLWLKYQLWPRIRQQLPEAELHIYGAYPPPKASELHHPPSGFLIKGWAEDLIVPTQNARVVLAPLRFGAGLKGKLFEAMKSYTPSVTTSIGAEGITNGDDWPGTIVDNADSLVEAAVKLYSNEQFWSIQQAKILPVLTSFLSNVPTKLLVEINRISGNIESQRANNFVGRLLCQEMLRSHKYMGLWIEAKTNHS